MTSWFLWDIMERDEQSSLFFCKEDIVMYKKRIYEIQLLFEGALVGILTGTVVSAFRWLLDWSEVVREVVYSWGESSPSVLLLWFSLLFLVAAVLCRIAEKEPMASGSGIPQVKGILLGRMRMNWFRVLYLKFLGAVLGIGAGLSLGRQGPSVQFGACIGQGISRLWGRSGFREERNLLTAGAGAGLAAAFNAPLAGVVFCMEELAPGFSAVQVLSGILAAAVSTAVSRTVFGAQPVFHLEDLPVILLGGDYVTFLLLGLFCGFLGLLFNRGLLFSLEMYDRLSLQSMAKVMPALLLAGILGFFLPEVLGGGNTLVDKLLVMDYELSFLLVLLVAKYFFTLLCFGSGSPGGIFLPMMALGATAGAIFAKGALFFGIMDPSLAPCCIVFGMAGYFAGAVKSPVSSSILIMELTGSFDHMLILLCISLSACLILDMFGVLPIYDAILRRSSGKKSMRRH